MKWCVLFSFVWSIFCSPALAVDSAPRLIVASSGTHLWIAVPTESGCRILHHALEMDGAFSREVTALSALPVALAALENQLAIIMPPAGIPLTSAVYSLTAHRNPATGSFYYQPLGRLDVLPSIQSSAHIANAVVGLTGPLALLSGEKPELIRAEQLSWSTIPLPGNVGANAKLVPWPESSGSSRGSMVWAILSVDGADLLTTMTSTAADTADGWSQTRWVGAGMNFEMVIGGSIRPAILTRQDGGTFAIAYPTSTGLRSLGAISVPSHAWSIAGLGEGFKIVWTDEAGAVRLASVDSLSGAAGVGEILIPQITTTGDWIHLPFIGALTIGMLLAGFIVRPPMQPPHPMQGGWEALPMFRRIGALAVDMFPGALLSLWITGAQIDELLSMPSWTPDLSHAVPASILLGFTGIWSGIFEVFLRATPGKFIFGGRIVRAPDGGTDMRAGLWRTVLRALLKTIVLFAPALGFLAFVHPLQQGLPETLSKTVVARRH